jgi:hypothetical protein
VTLALAVLPERVECGVSLLPVEWKNGRAGLGEPDLEVLDRRCAEPAMSDGADLQKGNR